MKFPIFVLVYVFIFSSLYAQPEIGKKEEDVVIELALRKKLWKKVKWHRLLHYRPNTIFSGVTSEATGSRFFMAADGRTNPKAELIATIKGFYHGDKKRPKLPHPYCRFPARRKWILNQLSLPSNTFPKQECKNFDIWYHQVKAKSLTMVFSSFYMNSPGSMFGHTFLKANKSDRIDSPELLDYGINYSAYVGNANPISYVIGGLFGGFDGYFAVLAYYFKVNEYNNAESRDIWEYKLNFSEEETDFALLHLWELGAVSFPYYFLTKNCSYQVLTLLEAAREDYHLSDQFAFHVIPVDTLRVLKKNNLIKGVKYRPSVFSKFMILYAKLNSKEKKLLREIIAHEKKPDAIFSSINEERQPLLFDTAIAYLAYEKQYRLGNLEKEQRNLYLDLLRKRSKIKNVFPHNKNEKPEGVSDPLESHKSPSFTFSAGYSSLGAYLGLTWRPALHDYLDLPKGYLRGSKVQVFDTEIRIFPKYTFIPQLWHWKLLDLMHLSPFHLILKNFSWRTTLAFENRNIEYQASEFHNNQIYFYFQGGPGISFPLWPSGPIRRFLFYTLLNLKTDFGGGLKKGYRLNINPEAGIISYLLDNFGVQLSSQYQYSFLGDEFSFWKFFAGFSLFPSMNTAIRWESAAFVNQESAIAIFNYESKISFKVFF